MILGGTTTTQGGGFDPASEPLLARTVEAVNFGRQRIFSRVAPIGLLSASDKAALCLVDFYSCAANGARNSGLCLFIAFATP